jgi:hypothetical protein
MRKNAPSALVNAVDESVMAVFAFWSASSAFLPREPITFPDSSLVRTRQMSEADNATTSKMVGILSTRSLCAFVRHFLPKSATSSPVQAIMTKASEMYSPRSQPVRDDTSGAVNIILAHQRRERRLPVCLVAPLMVLVSKSRCLASCRSAFSCLGRFLSRCFALIGLSCFFTYGMTRNGTLLVRIPPGVVTLTKPVVAPWGTIAVR